MINWIHPPKLSSLKKYIDCYWFLEKNHSNQSYSYPKLNPDPAAHLILSAAHQPYHYEWAERSVAGYGCHWLFPHCQTFQLDHSKPVVHLGVKFHIGALYSLNHLLHLDPKQAILDAIIDADTNALFGDERIDEERILTLAGESPENCCAELDKLFTPCLEHCLEDSHSQLSRKALPLLSDSPISELGAMLDCSQRTLERSFSRVTGLSLKQCQSMNRLEDLLEYLYQRNSMELDWAHIAYQFGFSDQPHLIRHLKSTIGSTPKTYADKRDLTIDIYGGIKPN